jgi:hypothetical protein
MKQIRNILLAVIFVCLPSLSAAAQEVIPIDKYRNIINNIDLDEHVVSAYEFEDKMTQKEVVILDLRSEEEFKRSHIKGAKHLGADIDEKKLKELVPSTEATVLIYCQNSLSEVPRRMISLTSPSLYQMVALGYENTYYLEDLFGQNVLARAVKEAKIKQLLED